MVAKEMMDLQRKTIGHTLSSYLAFFLFSQVLVTKIISNY